MTRFDPRAGLIEAATELIRRPSPELGWTGDTDLYVVWARLTRTWEVWREDGDGNFRCLIRQPLSESGQPPDPAKIIRNLVSRDTYLRNNSAEKQVEEIMAYNERLENERLDKAAEDLRETMERIYYAAAAQDLKHETGYVRPMTVSSELKTILDSAVIPIPD